jgi:hypothetical protein
MTSERNEALTDLIERVGGLTGASREVDRAIMALTHDWEERHIGATDEYDEPVKDWVWVDRTTGHWRTTARDGFEFTSSTDAALALAEKLLPGVWWFMSKGRYREGEPLYGFHLLAEGYNSDRDSPLAESEHENLCCAIILATLRALSASKGDTV